MIYKTPFDVPLDEYKGLIARREYWDDGSDEWNWSSLDLKLVRLAGFVQQDGDLNKVMTEYTEDLDEYKRQRIQYCVVSFILKLMVGERLHISDNVPLVERVKCLNKEELIELLTEELKRDVKKDEKMDDNYKTHEDWVLLSDNQWMSDEILDSIEHRHWRENPEESYTTYSNRAQYWWNNRSLW